MASAGARQGPTGKFGAQSALRTGPRASTADAAPGNKSMDAESEWGAGEARKYEEWLDACRKAADFLDGKTISAEPATAYLTVVTAGEERSATVRNVAGHPTPCRTTQDVATYLRTEIHARLVRREGWTVPEDDGRIEPDTASLVLNPNNPGVRLTAQIGIDGTWVEPRLEHTASDGQWQTLPTTKAQGLEHAARNMSGTKAART